MRTTRKLIPRFSIRGLLLLVFFLAVFLATFGLNIFIPHHQEMQRIANISASVPTAQLYTEPKGQYWFRHFFGDRFSERLVYVHLDDSTIDDRWVQNNLSHLQHVEVLSIASTSMTDVGLNHLRKLPRLNSLTLTNTQITGDAILELRKHKQRALIQLQIREPDGSLHAVD